MLVPGVEWGPGCFLLWTLPRYPQEHTGAQRSTAGEQGVKASLGLQSWGSQMPGGPEGAWHPQPYPLPDITPAPSSSLLQLRATGLSWQLSQEASQRRASKAIFGLGLGHASGLRSPSREHLFESVGLTVLGARPRSLSLVGSPKATSERQGSL